MSRDELKNATLDLIADELVSVLLTNTSNNINRRISTTKFADWRTAILEDNDLSSVSFSKGQIVAAINSRLSTLNWKLVSTKSGFYLQKSDILSIPIGKDFLEVLDNENIAKGLARKNMQYNNTKRLTDFKIDNSIPDNKLEEDGLIFLVCAILFIHGGRMKMSQFEEAMELFINPNETPCGTRNMKLVNFLTGLNTSGYIKTYDGDEDLDKIQGKSNTVVKCIMIGPTALEEFTPMTMGRFISEIKNIPFSDVIRESTSLHSTLKQDQWYPKDFQVQTKAKSNANNEMNVIANQDSSTQASFSQRRAR